MSGLEILVVFAGVGLGYWAVTLLMSGARPAALPACAAPPWHTVLQVAETATVDQIQAAHDTLAARYHPDQLSGLGPEFQSLAARQRADLDAAGNAA